MLERVKYEDGVRYLRKVNNGRLESYYGFKEGDKKIIERLKNNDYDGYDLTTLKFIFQMGVWDKYLKFVDVNDTFVNSLHYIFEGKDYWCENWKPMGPFKEYSNLSEEEIFERMKARALNTKTVVDGVEMNLIDLFVEHLKKWKKKLGYDDILFTRKDVVLNFAAMNVRGIKGILTEKFVLDALRKQYNDCETFKIVFAPDDWETHDIDIAIKDISDDSIKFISVKHGKAFHDESLKEYRVVRGKTKPHFYIDFQEDFKDGRLVIKKPVGDKFIKVDSIFEGE